MLRHDAWHKIQGIYEKIPNWSILRIRNSHKPLPAWSRLADSLPVPAAAPYKLCYLNLPFRIT
ncbi:MAG: hypothetical protein JWL90_1873 [Chthoniobacteraceae bacterium]|nr:hypothetical protein [Chthoniobacteraceae bacterium]